MGHDPLLCVELKRHVASDPRDAARASLLILQHRRGKHIRIPPLSEVRIAASDGASAYHDANRGGYETTKFQFYMRIMRIWWYIHMEVQHVCIRRLLERLNVVPPVP